MHYVMRDAGWKNSTLDHQCQNVVTSAHIFTLLLCFGWKVYTRFHIYRDWGWLPFTIHKASPFP